MEAGHRRARALIRVSALRHNLALTRKHAPGSRVVAVIKADAYGHGMAAITGALAAEVDAFAVATLQEGVDCRRVNPQTPVIVLSELSDRNALSIAGELGLQPVLHSSEQVAWLEDYRGAPLSVWLKVDTGMHRHGVAPHQVADIVRRLRQCRHVGTLRIMSHLANGDDVDDDYSNLQLDRFHRCSDDLELERSMANSAGVMRWPDSHFQWVRPGIMLYGGSPLLGQTGPELGLRPVMQLESRLLAVKTIPRGVPVGYGGTYVTPAQTRIGLVGFGYGDGYPRVIDRAAAVLVNGRRAPIIGRVAMDMITVDLAACPQAVMGDPVVLWGDELGVDDVAGWAGTISYELLCKVTGRIPREVVD